MMFAKLISNLRYKYLLKVQKLMMENFPLDHLMKHLEENHDSNWRFDYIDWDGTMVLNCYLPIDSPETYLMISWSDYSILEVGKNVPQGLIDEVKMILDDGYQIYIGWESTNLPNKWAQKTLLTESLSHRFPLAGWG